MEEGQSPATLRPVLDSVFFGARLDEEVARVGRSGGFLSLALLGYERASYDAGPPRDLLDDLAHALRGRIRIYDILARRGAALALLMPDTDMTQAVRAVERVLQLAQEDRPPSAVMSPGVAVATIYGDLEGGGGALLGAAEDALAAARPGQIERSPSLAGRPKLLIVDDNLAFASALAETLSERGWEGHPCSDSGDAVQRVKGPTYSGLFVDLAMRGTGGVQILREALLHNPRRPAVLMSGHDADRGAVIDALSLGPVTFIGKPIAGAELDFALGMFRSLLPGRGPRR